MKKIKAFEHMIKKGMYALDLSPWYAGSKNRKYLKDMPSLKEGQINYKGEIFVFTIHPAEHGMGGMGQGSPEEYSILRIKL